MATSNVQRTIRQLKLDGCVCAVAEKWNPYIRNGHGGRQDLLGFIDILALYPSKGIVAIQACGADFAAHRRKIIEDRTQEVLAWLECGGKIEIWGWRKLKIKRGGKAERWTPRIEPVTMEDFAYDSQQATIDRPPGDAEAVDPGGEGQDQGDGQDQGGSAQYDIFAGPNSDGYFD